MPMLSPLEIKVGVAFVADTTKRAYDETHTAQALSFNGISEHNITFKYIPGNNHIVLGVLFFAEYTDVDCVIVVSRGVLDDVTRKSLYELQIQWNMPVAVAAQGDDVWRAAQEAVEMVQLQSDMATDAPNERMASIPPRKDSIN